MSSGVGLYPPPCLSCYLFVSPPSLHVLTASKNHRNHVISLGPVVHQQGRSKGPFQWLGWQILSQTPEGPWVPGGTQISLWEWCLRKWNWKCHEPSAKSEVGACAAIRMPQSQGHRDKRYSLQVPEVSRLVVVPSHLRRVPVMDASQDWVNTRVSCNVWLKQPENLGVMMSWWDWVFLSSFPFFKFPPYFFFA